MAPYSPGVSFYPHGVPSLSTGALLRSARYAPLKREFTRSLFMRLILVKALNLTASYAVKSMSRAKRPIKFYAERSKSGSHKLAQKPILRRNFTLSYLKKPLFSYKFVK